MTTSCDFLGKLLWFSCKQSTVHFWISVYNPKQPVLHSLPCFIYYYIFSLITVATPKGSSQSATRTCLSLICVKIRIFTKHAGWFQYFISKTFLLNSKELFFFLIYSSYWASLLYLSIIVLLLGSLLLGLPQ